VTPPSVYHAHASGVHPSLAQSVPDPRVMDDESLRAAYIRFLVEMETRGLHSMSLNPSQPPAPAVTPTAHASTNGVSQAASLGSGSNGNVTMSASAKDAHSSLPPHLNPNINPVDIRKNQPRSKSGGSESAFYPNAMFPGASAGTPQAGSTSAGVPTGRKTPNSPLMGRYMHGNDGRDGHEELHWPPEPEDAELGRAFGQHRHPGSPSYPAYSPFHHLTSGAAQASHVHAHTAHGAQAGGYHGSGSGNTPTSVAVGSANWSATTSTAVPTASTAAPPHNTASTSAHAPRSVSRCSGVIPQLDNFDIHMRHNCLSTLPQTHSQYMYTHSVSGTANGPAGAANGSAPGSNGAAGTANGATANGAPGANGHTSRSVDLKTPKFVRKFQGIGAGSLGLTSQRYAHLEEERDETSVEAEPAPQAHTSHHGVSSVPHGPSGRARVSSGTHKVAGAAHGAGSSGHSGSARSAAG
jgi:hypothetical protein